MLDMIALLLPLLMPLWLIILSVITIGLVLSMIGSILMILAFDFCHREENRK